MSHLLEGQTLAESLCKFLNFIGRGVNRGTCSNLLGHLVQPTRCYAQTCEQFTQTQKDTFTATSCTLGSRLFFILLQINLLGGSRFWFWPDFGNKIFNNTILPQHFLAVIENLWSHGRGKVTSKRGSRFCVQIP